jgi:predicted HTH transcriptional regulator
LDVDVGELTTVSSEWSEEESSVFADRIEITNPGKLLIELLHIMDEPPRSRNELMAWRRRHFNICEERVTGIDKVVDADEHSHLPAPEFVVTQNHFKAVLFASRALNAMSKEDKIRAGHPLTVAVVIKPLASLNVAFAWTFLDGVINIEAVN